MKKGVIPNDRPSKPRHRNEVSERTVSEHYQFKGSEKGRRDKGKASQSVIAPSKSDNNLKKGLNTKKKSLQSLHVKS